jgi:hypothetical protein
MAGKRSKAGDAVATTPTKMTRQQTAVVDSGRPHLAIAEEELLKPFPSGSRMTDCRVRGGNLLSKCLSELGVCIRYGDYQEAMLLVQQCLDAQESLPTVAIRAALLRQIGVSVLENCGNGHALLAALRLVEEEMANVNSEKTKKKSEAVVTGEMFRRLEVMCHKVLKLVCENHRAPVLPTATIVMDTIVNHGDVVAEMPGNNNKEDIEYVSAFAKKTDDDILELWPIDLKRKFPYTLALSTIIVKRNQTSGGVVRQIFVDKDGTVTKRLAKAPLPDVHKIWDVFYGIFERRATKPETVGVNEVDPNVTLDLIKVLIQLFETSSDKTIRSLVLTAAHVIFLAPDAFVWTNAKMPKTLGPADMVDMRLAAKKRKPETPNAEKYENALALLHPDEQPINTPLFNIWKNVAKKVHEAEQRELFNEQMAAKKRRSATTAAAAKKKRNNKNNVVAVVAVDSTTTTTTTTLATTTATTTTIATTTADAVIPIDFLIDYSALQHITDLSKTAVGQLKARLTSSYVYVPELTFGQLSLRANVDTGPDSLKKYVFKGPHSNSNVIDFFLARQEIFRTLFPTCPCLKSYKAIDQNARYWLVTENIATTDHSEWKYELAVDGNDKTTATVQKIVRDSLGFCCLSDTQANIREAVLFGGDDPLFPYMIAAAVLSCKDIGCENVLYVHSTKRAYIIDYEESDSARRIFAQWSDVCKHSRSVDEIRAMAKENIGKRSVLDAIRRVLTILRSTTVVPEMMIPEMRRRIEMFEKLLAKEEETALPPAVVAVDEPMKDVVVAADESSEDDDSSDSDDNSDVSNSDDEPDIVIEPEAKKSRKDTKKPPVPKKKNAAAK